MASSPSFAEVCGGPLGGRELNLEFLHHLFGASVTGFLRPSLPPLRRYLATVWPEAHVAYRAVAIYLWIHLYLQDRTTNYRHLADQVGCTPTQVDHILTAAPRPDYELIIDLAEALHADRLWIARLLRRAGIQPPGSRSGPPHPSHGTPPTSSRFLRETVDLAGLLNPTAPGADNPARRPPPPTPPKPSD
ncbi:hypothetical protein [Streptoalloteichus tenebrarius]|uniref:hypothetical protein n=1 Tax=Streptoalloteichus tenebrarius (strain ATCC 17920 / DSM 40477 / JCM 4838 / CBS 697.72 / NBRC 16177 / NCIMB 11028 / NRRL B-12390 / A12253. 1 / ISP 5477) TaxID=1933 RepID=UPI0020A403CE|nr:hypothetical protein [Streptoalloteichus tenebrarius]